VALYWPTKGSVTRGWSLLKLTCGEIGPDRIILRNCGNCSLSEDPETIMETIREDSRFEDLAHEEATISAVVRERLKQFRSKN
jgi:hypothetical protein